MRRILVLLVLLPLLPLLAGCASGPLGGSEVRVGVAADYPPIVFEEKGRIRGVEPDLMAEIAKDLGWRIRYVPTDFDDLELALMSRQVDVIMGGLSITKKRASRVAFTKSYFRLGQMTLIRAEDVGRLTPVAKIFRIEARVGFQAGTTGELVAKALERATRVPFRRLEDGLAALRAAKIDYFVHDAPTVWRHASKDAKPGDLVGLFTPLSEEHLAFAVRRSEPDRKREIDQAIARVMFDGRLQPILDRWIEFPVEVR